MAENTNSRLETFCDGVFAIALTLLVLEIKMPVAEGINNTDELWHALLHLLPALFAFLLSFAIIIISWVNHHGAMKLVDKSNPKFIYANVFMLLTIVILPLPTALFAEFGFTDSAVPAVVLYGFVMLLTNVSWIVFTRTALKPVPLTKSESATRMMQNIRKQSHSAFLLYLVCTIFAFWFPLVVSIILTLTWAGWFIMGLTYKQKEHLSGN